MDILIQYALDHLAYNKDDGSLVWIKIPPRYNGKVCAVGKEAGSIHHTGYRVITLYGKKVQAHRLAWAMTYKEWPVGEIDHANGIRNDNRIENLRVVTRTQNMQNARCKSNSASGIKNVQWDSSAQLWRVRVRVDGKRYHVGRFKNIDDAALAAKEFINKSHKQFARV